MKILKNSNCLMIALVLSLLFVLLFAQAASAQNVGLSAGQVTGAVGDTVTVSVSVTNALATTGGQFDLSYGPSTGGTVMLEPISISGGDFVPGFSNDNFNMNVGNNKLRVLWVTAAGSSKDSGVICNIVFKITQAGETQLNFSEVLIVDAPEGGLPAALTSGKVTGTTTVTEPDSAKAQAIKAANDAIAALPATISLNDRSDVQKARNLVNVAINPHGATNSDFPDLAKLEAAEKRIKELDGSGTPTPPTGDVNYLFMGGALILAAGLVIYLKRKQLASVK